MLARQWLYDEGVIYHYRYFDVDRSEIDSLSIFELGDGPWSLARRTYATHASYGDEWQGRNVWSREFPTAPEAPSSYRKDAERAPAHGVGARRLRRGETGRRAHELPRARAVHRGTARAGASTSSTW